ncbi:MAG TPA: hypothetical protein VF776_08365 [Sphingomicrobium sp.]
MILLILAAAALAQWTGPRTEEYRGPGYYCGGGYAVRLARGDRALILPQGQAPQATRLVLAGREINILTGVRKEPGVVVSKSRGSLVIQQNEHDKIAYIISDQTPYGLRVTSDAFRGFRRDSWFFTRANFANDADERIQCLSAYSN